VRKCRKKRGSLGKEEMQERRQRGKGENKGEGRNVRK
jgi:hypothetical protein